MFRYVFRALREEEGRDGALDLAAVALVDEAGAGEAVELRLGGVVELEVCHAAQEHTKLRRGAMQRWCCDSVVCGGWVGGEGRGLAQVWRQPLKVQASAPVLLTPSSNLTPRAESSTV